ncbi:hypothetical protein KP509_33G057500 [Ceratopteris richardii]|uniref:Uncharacterized protein n=1 Tax=Ceratopteris richardii TaxID=49495 RepID=A0A8T2QRH4_CERRI|nr:hypothetical protein KP509_33G057500 [Ceratopteris richardii]KAH7286076.1 hypothetical protein KP509_33G057500 [Ceratopteris richardii]
MAATSSPPSASLHAGADEEDESLKDLGPCAKHYLDVQECLMNTNRNWIACQNAVRLLKACHELNKEKATSKEKATTIHHTSRA